MKDNMSKGLLATAKNMEKVDKGSVSATRSVLRFTNKAGKAVTDFAAKTVKWGTAAASAAAVGLGAMAVKAGAAADDLNTLSKQSGFSTADIQKWTYASDLVDVSVDSIVGAAKKMKKNMVSTSSEVQEAWKAIGVSATDGTGALRDSTTVFYEALDGLSRIENETERDILAMQLFGKSADSLAGIADDGGASLRELGQQAESLGLVLSQEALDGANAFNDKIDTMKAKASAAFSKIGNSLATRLLPVMDRFGPVVDRVMDGAVTRIMDKLDQLGTKLEQWDQDGTLDRLATQFDQGLARGIDMASGAFQWVVDNGDTIKGVLIGVGTALAAVKILKFASDTIAAVKTVQQFMSVATMFLTTNPLCLGIMAAVGGLALLAANWDRVKEAAGAAIAWIGDKLSWLDQKIEGIPLIGDLYKGAKSAVGWVADRVAGAASFAAGQVGGNALGTSYFSGGLTRVHERGGEILNLPGGTQIIPHDVSRRMGGPSVNVYVTVQGNVIGNAQYADSLGQVIVQRILRALDNT